MGSRKRYAAIRTQSRPARASGPCEAKGVAHRTAKEILALFREENKVLKTEKRERIFEMRRLKTENDTLRRENQLLRASVASRATVLPNHQQKISEDNLRRENQQLKQMRDGQHVHLCRIGGAHEFQRQHIEHLRRNILALQQQVSQLGGQPQQDVQHSAHTTAGHDPQEVTVIDSGDQPEEQQQSKRRRTSEG